MKTKLRIVLASVLVAAGLAVTAGAASYDNCADQLKDLGLFQGTEDGYELDRAPTRGEAATMLVRLLGKEAEAKELTYEAPFTDLDDWQKPYVQYLYDNKPVSYTHLDVYKRQYILCCGRMSAPVSGNAGLRRVKSNSVEKESKRVRILSLIHIW